MTEVDIIRDLECCVEHDCATCSRRSVDTCGEDLDRDILSVLKLQRNALEQYREDFDRLTKESARLSAAVNRNYSKLELVQAVNRIIKSCYDTGYCYECSGDPWSGKIEAIKSFIELIGEENCAVAVGVQDDFPLILCIEPKK